MTRVNEPLKEETVWKLGMTKGALIAVVILYVAVAVVVWKLKDTSDEAHNAAVSAKQAAIQAQFVAQQAGHLAFTNQKLVKQGIQSKAVLCAQQKSLRASVRASVQFLVDVEIGKRVMPQGITKDDILVQIKRNQDLLSSFDGLHCPS